MVRSPSGFHPLVGCDRLLLLESQYAKHVGEMFAISGVPEDTRAIPGKAAQILDAAVALGAAMFKLVRRVRGTARDGKIVTMNPYVTIFCPKAEHGELVMERHREGKSVTVLAQIVVAERRKSETSEERWDGLSGLNRENHHPSRGHSLFST